MGDGGTASIDLIKASRKAQDALFAARKRFERDIKKPANDPYKTAVELQRYRQDADMKAAECRRMFHTVTNNA